MLLLLALQLGHWNGGYLLYWGYLGQEHCFLGRGRRRLSGGAGIVCTSTVYGVFRVLSAASAGRGSEWLEGLGLQVLLTPLLGSLWLWLLLWPEEAGIMCIISAAATGSLGLRAQPL